MATNIHAQSQSSSYYRHRQQNSLNRFQAGAVTPVRGGLNPAGWYSGGGQAPSVGGTSQQSLFSQLSSSYQTYNTSAQAPSVGGTSQSRFSQLSGSDQTYYTYAQAPSVGGTSQSLFSQLSGSDRTYNTYAQAPSVGGTSQSLFSQLAGSDRPYNTYAQAPSVGTVGQTLVSASTNYQMYSYQQPPSVGAVSHTYVSRLSGSYQGYSTHGQAPSVAAVKQTVVSQVSSNYQIYSNLQPPSVGAVRQTFASQFSGNHQGYSTQPQAPSVGAVRQTVVSQLSGSDKTYSGGQPPTSNTLRTRSKNNYKDVSEKSDSALHGKNSGTHKRASFIGNGVPYTGKKVSSTGDEAFAMSLGLDAYGQANHETDLFSFPNLEDYKSIARHYRHRRPKGE
ncbi:hypothetical protein L1887_23651 [Cichorium endivia]|nr:hypothetical protein L1887_23651 [Cichorium endivia]